MSPRRGTSIRSRSNGTPGPARRATRAIGDRMVQVRCPYCPGFPPISRARWPEHERAHKTADNRRDRNTQRVTRVRNRSDPGAPPSTPRGRNGVPANVHFVDNDGNRIDWLPGDPDPDTPATPVDQVWPGGKRSGGYRAGPHVAVMTVAGAASRGLAGFFGSQARSDGAWITGRARAGWAAYAQPFRSRPRRATSTDGKRWKERTHDPGFAPQTTPPTVVPIRPTGAPAVTTPDTPADAPTPPRRQTTGGSSRRSRSAPATTPTSPASATAPAGGAAGAAETLAEAAKTWARATPENLADARRDAQVISEALAGLGDALVLRMSLETDRGISAACVDPYQDAANKARQMAEDVQDVHARLLRRYGAVADELARPDTPDAEYLKHGT